MPSETLYPTSLVATSNLNNAGVALVDEDIDTGSPDTDFADWDGNGNVTVRYGFDTPSGQLSIPGLQQQFRVRLRPAQSGNNVPVVAIRLFEAGSDTGSSISYNITQSGFNEYVFNWDASNLAAQSGVNVQVEIDQTAGGSGNPNRRTGIDIASINWEVAYDLPPGGAPEPNVVWV